MKKIFIISTVILILSGAVFVSYNFVLTDGDKSEKKVFVIENKNDDVEVEKIDDTENKKKNEKAKVAIAGAIEKISSTDVLFPKISEDGKRIKYYSKNDEGFWEMSPDGSFKKKVANENIPDLKAIIWSLDGKNIIIKRSDGFYRYYSNTGDKIKIKEGPDFLVWSNLGDKIIYDFKSGNEKGKSMNIADPDGSNWTVLAKTDSEKNVIRMIPESSLISFWNVPRSSDESLLRVVSVAGGKTQTIVSGKFGADYLWSPKGDKFLVSSTTEKGGDSTILELGEINFNEGNIEVKLRDLRLPTLASKCVWSKNDKTVYCALLSGVPDNAVMPDDYFAKKFYTADYFWKIDTDTGKKERIVELDEMKEDIDATDLFLSPNEDMLFFVNRKDGFLYRIIL